MNEFAEDEFSYSTNGSFLRRINPAQEKFTDSFQLVLVNGNQEVVTRLVESLSLVKVRSHECRLSHLDLFLRFHRFCGTDFET